LIVISHGLTKSGSTLAFEMTRAVLCLNGHAQPKLPDGLVTAGHHINFVHHFDDDRLSRLVEYTRNERIVVKTHGDPSRLTARTVVDCLRRGDLEIQGVVRDRRDTVLSLIDAGVRARTDGTESFSTIQGVDDGIALVRRHLSAPSSRTRTGAADRLRSAPRPR